MKRIDTSEIRQVPYVNSVEHGDKDVLLVRTTTGIKKFEPVVSQWFNAGILPYVNREEYDMVYSMLRAATANWDQDEEARDVVWKLCCNVHSELRTEYSINDNNIFRTYTRMLAAYDPNKSGGVGHVGSNTLCNKHIARELLSKYMKLSHQMDEEVSTDVAERCIQDTDELNYETRKEPTKTRSGTTDSMHHRSSRITYLSSTDDSSRLPDQSSYTYDKIRD